MQKVKETTDKHLVFVADSDGINTVFLMLVERLKDDRLYGDFYHTYLKIRNRKINRTKFLDSLKDANRRKMDEQDEK